MRHESRRATVLPARQRGPDRFDHCSCASPAALSAPVSNHRPAPGSSLFDHVFQADQEVGPARVVPRGIRARREAIVEATVRVYLSRDEVLADGERMRRIYDLPLRRATSPIFSMSWLATHTIDEHSPLAGVTPGSLLDGSVNLIVTFQGIDDRLAATVHTRYAYNPEDITFDRRFVDRIAIGSGRSALAHASSHASQGRKHRPRVTTCPGYSSPPNVA